MEGDLKKATAFQGRVSLPFLCPAPPDGKSTLAYLADVDMWVVYRYRAEGPRVEMRGLGLLGLQSACLMMLAASTATPHTGAAT